jgi:hypothetical protein
MFLWLSPERPSTLKWYKYTILSSSGSQKKIGHELIYLFSFAAVTVKWSFSNIQFSNFKTTVIPSSLVAILLVHIWSVKFTF